MLRKSENPFPAANELVISSELLDLKRFSKFEGLSEILKTKALFQKMQSASPKWAYSLVNERSPLPLREIRCSFSGHLLRGFATSIWHLAVQNTVRAELRITRIFSVCLSVCSFFSSAAFFDDFCEEFICDFIKKTLKKGDPGWQATPRWTVFCLRPDPNYPRSLALSSSCACGATCPAGSF